jgi:hypothetical protein
MKAYFLIFLALIGCSPMYKVDLSDKFRAVNRDRLNSLSLGMNKSQVLDVMGTVPYEYYGNITNNPYRVEAYTIKQDVVNVIFYWTDVRERDGAITEDELTPIVLINDKVVGWGWTQWEQTAVRYSIRIR